MRRIGNGAINGASLDTIRVQNRDPCGFGRFSAIFRYLEENMGIQPVDVGGAPFWVANLG